MTFQLEHIAFSYKSKVGASRSVFTDLNLSIGSGAFVLIAGEEGSGKTTLLHVLAGLQRPNAGMVAVDGKHIWESAEQLRSVRRRIGVAFQFPEQQFFCETVHDELLYASRNFHVPDARAAVRSALARLGLPSTLLSTSPFALSTGEARRVALASLLPSAPDAFLLDEPTAGLDGFGIAAVLSLLAELSRQRKTIILATHQTPLFFHLAHRLIELNEGRIAAEFDLRSGALSAELRRRFA
jgi:energy-coupling factor transport system ATP-binding protein